MIITFSDISRRIRNRDIRSTGSSMNPRLYTESGKFCTDNAVNAIIDWKSLGESSNEAFNKALDIFEEVCLNENASTIKSCSSYLVENVDKVRDASQLVRSLKIRAGRLNKKNTTKVTKQYEPINNAIKKSIADINKTLSINGVANSGPTVSAKEESFNFLLSFSFLGKV